MVPVNKIKNFDHKYARMWFTEEMLFASKDSGKFDIQYSLVQFIHNDEDLIDAYKTITETLLPLAVF